MDDLSSVIGAATGANAIPAPMRNNNPGALMANGKLQSFDTPQAGLDALHANLGNYAAKGVTTLAGAISKWAPPSENNTDAYIADAAKTTGLDPNAKIDLSDPATQHLVGRAIIKHENGAAYAAPDVFNADVIAQAINGSEPVIGHTASAPSIANNRTLKVPANAATTSGYGEAALNNLSGLGASVIGGYRGLVTLATGGSVDDATQAINEEAQNRTYQPQTEQGKNAVAVADLPGKAIGYVANKGGDVAYGLTGSPAIAAAVKTGITAAPMALPFMRRGAGTDIAAADASSELPPQYAPKPQVGVAQPATVPTAIPRQAAMPGQSIPGGQVSSAAPQPIDLGLSVPAAGTRAAAIESPPVAGGLPKDIQAERAAVLQRIGLDKTWGSALSGDAMEGATNAQMTKFNEPAGIAARDQFANEYDALQSHAEKIITDTGGTSGLTEDALHARGQAIAAPFDALSNYFDKATSALYDEAGKRSGGLPVVDTAPIDSILSDRSFNNSAMAQDKGNLVGAIKNQLDLFKENNQKGLTVANSEDFRKWLNQQWSPDNKFIIGKVKDAVDDSVMQSAGEDVYGQARQMSQLKKQTLENPAGVNRIMDTDPNTPINRTTNFEKIPDTVNRLSVDQFNNVIDTLKRMPDELQPLAQKSIAEIKAHMANKIADAGQPNTKTPSVFWNNRKVNDYIGANQGKIASVFDPAEISNIADLRKAGNILSVDASYPGSYAQASNAVKQGLMSRIIPSITTSLGGGAGALFGPGGAAAGAWAGRTMGEKMATNSAERAALKSVGKRMTPLSSMMNP